VLFPLLVFFSQIILSLKVHYLYSSFLIFSTLPSLNQYRLYSLNLYLLLFLLKSLE
jgi:hypothetical protein